MNATDPSYLKSQIIQNGLEQVDSTNDSSNSYKSDYMLNNIIIRNSNDFFRF